MRWSFEFISLFNGGRASEHKIMSINKKLFATSKSHIFRKILKIYLNMGLPQFLNKEDLDLGIAVDELLSDRETTSILLIC